MPDAARKPRLGLTCCGAPRSILIDRGGCLVAVVSDSEVRINKSRFLKQKPQQKSSIPTPAGSTTKAKFILIKGINDWIEKH